MLNLRLKRFTLWTVANDVADKLDSAAREFGASVDEIIETFECNQTADAHNPRRPVGRDRGALRDVARHRKTFEIDAIVYPVDFRRGIGTTLAEQVAAVIGFGCDELCCGTDLA